MDNSTTKAATVQPAPQPAPQQPSSDNRHSGRLVQTGRMPLPYSALVAILALSLVVNLPGLAVTPMLGTLHKIFPDATELDTQLLTMLPNLLIIPFVLMSGKLSLSRHKIMIVVIALLIFAASTIGYLFSSTMLMLIIFSCTLGIGAGLLIPFSTGLLADTFSGKLLMKQMGMQSGISNATLVCATFAVGWLSGGDWHLPFLVYMVCLIPLVLTPFLKKIPKYELTPVSVPTNDKHASGFIYADGMKCNARGFSIPRIVALIFFYFLLTFATISISEYTPFLVSKYKWLPDVTGTITSVYFLMVFIPGFFLTPIVRILKGTTIITASGIVCIGMTLFAFIPSMFVMAVGAGLVGLGYGIIQPLLYNKAANAICYPSLSTYSLSFVLSANYLAIVLAPLMIDGMSQGFKVHDPAVFPFIVSVVLSVIMLILALCLRHRFTFSIDKGMYE